MTSPEATTKPKKSLAAGMEGYRPVHRLTPLLRVWTFGVALVTIALFNFTKPVFRWLKEENVGVIEVAWALGGLVAALLVIFGISQIWWRRSGFKLDDEAVETRRGVLTNEVRTVRYDRMQAVDVVESFAPRLAGLASVRIEAAGGASAGLDIMYLPLEEAEEVRREILRHIRATQPDSKIGRKVSGEDGDDGDGSRELVPPIPIQRSLVGTAFQMSALITLAWAVVPIMTDLTMAAILPVAIGFLPRIWRTIDQSWRFTSSTDGNMFYLTYGLANRRSQSVPRDRVHAVQVRQPMLWRLFGWWTVSVVVAGYGSEGNKSTGTSKLLPIGTWQQARDVVDALGPLTFDELIDLSNVDYRSPRNARWVSPIDWKRQTVKVRPGVVAVTAGTIGRWYQMVETPHIQELSFERGVIQRRLGLAGVDLDLVPGAFSMSCRDMRVEDAIELVNTLRARELPPMQPVALPHDSELSGEDPGRDPGSALDEHSEAATRPRWPEQAQRD